MFLNVSPCNTLVQKTNMGEVVLRTFNAIWDIAKKGS